LKRERIREEGFVHVFGIFLSGIWWNNPGWSGMGGPFDATASRLIKAPCLKILPQSAPSLRSTLWQGIARAILFVEQAVPTARIAFGAPILWAISE
jgi:hypothetical protein